MNIIFREMMNELILMTEGEERLLLWNRWESVLLMLTNILHYTQISEMVKIQLSLQLFKNIGST
jgi:hypothetical protein